MKSLKNRTLGLRRAVILSGLLAFAGNLAAFEPDPARYQDYRTEGIAAPERLMSTSGAGALLSGNRFIASVHSSLVTHSLWPLQNAIARGDYAAAIDGAREGLEKNAPWRVDHENGVDYGSRYHEFALILADAYELNGDWRQALNARAALHGDKSDEFTWAKARILYATGDRENALKLICNATLSVSYISVDSVLQKRETEREERRERGWDELRLEKWWQMAETSPAWPEWFALWKLRDHCARVIYPELHYVAALGYQSKKLEKGLKEGEALFNAKQREGFERCLTFMEEELARLPEWKRARLAPQVEFLKSLQRLPYELGRLQGM